MDNRPACVICGQRLHMGQPFDHWSGAHLHRYCAMGSTRTCDLCRQPVTYTEHGHWVHTHTTGTVWCLDRKATA
jgi:hypothetical protein